MAFLCTNAPLAATQSRINLDAFEECDPCTLTAQLDLRLRLPAPFNSDAAVWTTVDNVTHRYAVVGFPDHLLLLNSQGSTLTRQPYALPDTETLSAIRDVRFRDGSIAILDGGRQEIFISDTLATPPRVLPAFDGTSAFLPMDGPVLVLAGMSLKADAVGYPLHMLNLKDGAILRHFGSTDGQFNLANPWARTVLVDRPLGTNTIWVARPNRLHFEEWTPKGALLSVIEGQPDWFPTVHSIPPTGVKPATRLREFAVDTGGRLWVVTWTADPDWSEALSSSQKYSSGEVIINTYEYFDTRLDVYDLNKRAHIGVLQFEDDQVRLLRRAGDVLLQIAKRAPNRHPAIELFRLEFHNPNGR